MAPTILNAAGDEMTQQISRKVGMNLFFTVLSGFFGLVLVGFGWCFWAIDGQAATIAEQNEKIIRAEAKVEGFTQAMSAQAVDLREIKTDVSWIKKTLDEATANARTRPAIR